MIKLYGTILLLFYQIAFTQENISEKKLNDFVFENVLEHHKEFDYKIHNAYLNQDYDKVKNLFNDFIENNLHNKIMNNFRWNRFRTRYKSLYDIELPILLMTRSSWSLPNIGEVEAINKIAKKYKKKVKFVVLFWDERKKMRKQGRKYSRHVEVVYINELHNKDPYTIKALKHVLGVPTSFIINKNKRVVGVNRPKATPFDMNKAEALNEKIKFIEEKLQNIFKAYDQLISEKSSVSQ